MIAKLLVLLCFIASVSSFNFAADCGSRYKPLSTASSNRISSGFGGIIPRLEPGLRWIGERVKHTPQLQKKNVEVTHFDLKLLSRAAKPTIAKGGLLVGAMRLMQHTFTKRTRALIMTVGFLVSSKFMFAKPAFAAAVSRSSTVPSVVRVAEEKSQSLLSRVFNFELSLLKFKKYSQLSPAERLTTTPVFYLANSRGNSYLQADTQAGKPEQKIITYFMSSEDATDYLNEMTQSNSQAGGPGSAEFRVMATSLERALNTVQGKKQSRKLGRYEVDTVHRIQPSSRQYENAMKVTAQVHKNNPLRATMALKGINIPLFRAQGLVLTRSNGEVVSPHYFALEDLQEDWKNLRATALSAAEQQQPPERDALRAKLKVPAEPKVSVLEFADVMCLAEGITPASIGPAGDAPGANPGAAKTGKFDIGALLRDRLSMGANKHSGDLTAAGAPVGTEGEKEEVVVAFVPPRREIEMIKRFYRNQVGLKNEFSKAKYLG